MKYVISDSYDHVLEKILLQKEIRHSIWNTNTYGIMNKEEFVNWDYSNSILKIIVYAGIGSGKIEIIGRIKIYKENEEKTRAIMKIGVSQLYGLLFTILGLFLAWRSIFDKNMKYIGVSVNTIIAAILAPIIFVIFGQILIKIKKSTIQESFESVFEGKIERE